MAAGAEPGAGDPTAELMGRMVFHSQGWGEMGVNTCAHGANMKPLPLRIKDKDYAFGLGVHAPAETIVDLDGGFDAFEAEVGVEWQQGNVGSVVFQVFVDGEKRFDSGVMREQDAPKPISIPVTGASELRLLVTDAGDGITCDCANWAAARLAPSKSPAAPSEKTYAEIAPFARVETWDPERQKGTAALRTEAFPAEDVRLGQELTPDTQGIYAAPVNSANRACIGLEWMERRMLQRAQIQFTRDEPLPDPAKARLQYWAGESPWQGEWKDADVRIEANGLIWQALTPAGKSIAPKFGTEKIRWLFDGVTSNTRIDGLWAWTRTPMQTAELQFACEDSLGDAAIEVYNGAFADGARSVTWKREAPLTLRVQYSLNRPWKTDRTVLRVRMNTAKGLQAFGVAVDDVLANEAVYVPEAGFFAKRTEVQTSFEEYKKKIADEKTVLERVRAMPDQTFAQAMEKVHNPIQDLGPMMISLAADNRKFVVEREGAVVFEPYDSVDQAPIDIPKRCRIAAKLGAGELTETRRELFGEWRPAPAYLGTDGAMDYAQTSCVLPDASSPVADSNHWLYECACCLMMVSMRNRSEAPAEATFALTFMADAPNNQPAELKPVEKGMLAIAGDRVLAYVTTRELKQEVTLTPEPGTGRLTVKLTVEPFKDLGRATQVFVMIPAWRMAESEVSMLDKPDFFRLPLDKYWDQALEGDAQITTPDPLLNNIIRASQMHCLLAARNEERGKRIAAWISSDRYGPLESEANSVIRGMDLMGNAEFARRAHDYFIHRYNPEGFLTTGYTVMGTGWHLWTLAEHYALDQDTDWLRGVAPEVARVCQWIVAQTDKTRKLDAHGEKPPEYGLVPPGVGADWNRFAYRFAAEGHYCAGLRDAAAMLDSIANPDAPALREAAETLRGDVLRAFSNTQERSPVLRLKNGAWVPAYPGMLNCFGRIEDIIPGEDGNRSWAYDVELGAHHLAAQQVIDPNDPAVGRMMDHMEDFWFLHPGMGDYPADKNEADWFDLGGFAKVQPYYARNAEIYALRDDVKPFIRSYFNSIPTLLSRETLSFWEHFHNTGGWNKTHETGYFLAQTRLMLAMERGDTLWIAPLITDQWLQDGAALHVAKLPTRFGRFAYNLASHIAQGFVEVTVTPPDRAPATKCAVRLRHPEGKTLKHIDDLSGAQAAEIDTEKQCVRFTPDATGPVTFKAFFE
jgi:hypothetical protein